MPIVNENISVSYTEMESDERLFCGNDMLSTVVSVLYKASKFVILSGMNGFYDSDPLLYPNTKLIEQIMNIDENTFPIEEGAGSRRRTGGMKIKLQVASLVIANGTDTIITNDKNINFLYDIIESKQIGILFSGKNK